MNHFENREYEDLSNGQLVLQDMVERLGIPVFNNVRSALESTARVRCLSIRSEESFKDPSSHMKSLEI